MIAGLFMELHRMSTPTTDRTPGLLTPREAAFRLLEAATQRSYQSNGLDGVFPITVDNRPMFRERDIEGLIRTRLQGAP